MSPDDDWITVLRANTVLNRRYRLDKRTRATSQSETFLAFDALLQRSVTVELPVNAGPEAEVFIYRRQVASALHHRNILATLDIGEDHGFPYVVCEYFAGDSLRNIISNEAPFDVDDVAILIEQLAQGLAYAHQRGIVHGSLAPESIIVDSAGLAKVTGFGMIEGQMFSESGSRGPVEGSPYLPSNLRGNSLITQAFDVHALAAIAYEMLTGVKPDATQAPYSPSVVNPAVAERAGETVLLGLLAFEQRTSLTASQFSHALTHWRSWSMQQSGTGSSVGAETSVLSPARVPAQPAFAWPAPDPERLEKRSATALPGPPPHERPPAPLKWLALAVVVLSIALAVLMLREDDASTADTLSEIPSELTELFSALSS